MSSVRENTIYSLKENVTGREDGGCRFRYVLSGEAISFFFDVEDEDIVSPYRKDNENIFFGGRRGGVSLPRRGSDPL